MGLYLEFPCIARNERGFGRTAKVRGEGSEGADVSERVREISVAVEEKKVENEKKTEIKRPLMSACKET